MRGSTSFVRALAIPSLLAALALIGACGGSSSPTVIDTSAGGNQDSTSNSISVRDNSFSPSATTVPVGTTVTWTWSGSNSHNVTFDDGSGIKSPTQTSGTFTRNFAAAGTYAYHCTIHGQAMSGTVTVK